MLDRRIKAAFSPFYNLKFVIDEVIPLRIVLYMTKKYFDKFKENKVGRQAHLCITWLI